MYLITLLIALVSLCSGQDLTAVLRVSEDEATVFLDITNTAAYSVSLLRWNLPLDQRFGSDSFRVAVNGHPITYIGPIVKYGGPFLFDYVVVPSNRTLHYEIRLSDSYDFSQPGNYDVMFAVDVLDYVVESEFNLLPHDRKEFTTYKSLKSNGVRITTTKAHLQEKTLKERPCTPDENDQIADGFRGAQTMIGLAANRIEERDTATYRTWFGTLIMSRWERTQQTIIRALNGLRSNIFNQACDNYPGVFAYVFPADPTLTIYFCDVFWTVPVTGGFDTKAGTVIHEASHFNSIGQTNDYAYGTEACRRLAISNPENAVRNADNYEYFSESEIPE